MSAWGGNRGTITLAGRCTAAAWIIPVNGFLPGRRPARRYGAGANGWPSRSCALAAGAGHLPRTRALKGGREARNGVPTARRRATDHRLGLAVERAGRRLGQAGAGGSDDNVLFVRWHDLGRYLGLWTRMSQPAGWTLAAEGICSPARRDRAAACSPSRGSLISPAAHPQSNGTDRATATAGIP